MANYLPGFYKPEKDLIGTVSKLELAYQWLLEHPEDRTKTGRELRDTVQPKGVKISHTYWNEAKKKIGN